MNETAVNNWLGQNGAMDLHLNGKVVLITGGTDGLGAALADRLVEEGARVAVCGRDPGRLAASEQRLRDAGGDALVVQADVTRPADLERFVDAAVARWGRLDGLVNNAGKSAAGRIDQVSDDDWIADLNLKVLAAVRCTRLAVPHLVAAGGGAIVNVLNTGAKAAGAGSLPTTASRAAGLAITKAASKDLGGTASGSTPCCSAWLRAASGGGAPTRRASRRKSCTVRWPRTPISRWAGWAGPRSSPTWRLICCQIAPPM